MFCLHFQLVFWPSSGEDIAQTQHTLAIPPKQVSSTKILDVVNTYASCTHSALLVNHKKIIIHHTSSKFAPPDPGTSSLLPLVPSCHVHSTWKHKWSGSHDTDLSGTYTSLQCIRHFANPQGLWILLLQYTYPTKSKWLKNGTDKTLW